MTWPATGRERVSDDDDVMVGIDAGGSRTRVRASCHGEVIYEGTGGPGNPLTADRKPWWPATWRPWAAARPRLRGGLRLGSGQ